MRAVDDAARPEAATSQQQSPVISLANANSGDGVYKPSLRQRAYLVLHDEAHPVNAARVARKIGASPVSVEGTLDRLYSDGKCSRYTSDGHHYYFIPRSGRAR